MKRITSIKATTIVQIIPVADSSMNKKTINHVIINGIKIFMNNGICCVKKYPRINIVRQMSRANRMCEIKIDACCG
jgi:hypothetical protein